MESGIQSEISNSEKKIKKNMCVCRTLPARITFIFDNYEIGYCSKCLNKIDKLTSEVAGTLNFCDNYSQLLEILRMIKNGVYDLTNEWFSDENTASIEPYTDEIFLIKCFKVKTIVINHVLKSWSLSKGNYRKIIKMLKKDKQKVSSLLLRYVDKIKPCSECFSANTCDTCNTLEVETPGRVGKTFMLLPKTK